jgi:hypothetical protein
MTRFTASFALTAALAATTLTNAGAPVYTVETIATYETTTTLTGSSGTGLVCGWQVLDGTLQAFVADAEQGVRVLPLPDGFLTAAALDVNADGTVVGAVAQNGFPFDSGEPAIWSPAGSGSYTVTIPQQFETMPGPLGTLSINGGMAVAINDAGTIVGWSRYQGFGGGPATQFQLAGAPTDLREFGFDATPTDLSEGGVVVGSRLRLDLNSGETTELGLPEPAGGVAFTMVFAYSVNDNNQVVAAARRATSTADRWLTYTHDDANGWQPLNPSQIPTPFVGFYDNNNLNDVVATGGVLFDEENALSSGFAPLLDPESSNWAVALGFIADDRRVYTTAYDASSDNNAIVVLVPDSTPACIGDTNADGTVDLADLNLVLGNFGQTADSGDTNADGVVDLADLNTVLAAFGTACD